MGSSPTRRRSLSRRGLREGGHSSGGTRLRASGPGFYQVVADEAAFRATLARLGRPGRSIRSNRACPVAAIDRQSRPIRGRCQSRHLRQGGSTRALTRARELSCPPPCDRLLVSGTTVHHVACSEAVFYLPQGRSHLLFRQPMHSLDAMHDMYVDGHGHRTATVTGRLRSQDGYGHRTATATGRLRSQDGHSHRTAPRTARAADHLSSLPPATVLDRVPDAAHSLVQHEYARMRHAASKWLRYDELRLGLCF